MIPTAASSPPAATAAATVSSAPSRLMSLDALRGFDMFWIVGADSLVEALHKLNHSAPISFFQRQLTHKDWAGFAFYDLIFPLFVFMVGISIVYSLSKTVAQGGRGAALRRIFWRTALLYVLGLLTYGGISAGLDRVRLLGVLQRIAICYGVAATLFLFLRPRGLVAVCAGLLVGYWAVMTFVPVPGVGAGNFAEGLNYANYIDKEHLAFRRWDGDHDPEGILSTFPAIATCLLGVFAGLLLKNPNVTEQRKVKMLLGAGVAGVVLGFLWGLQFPVIKKIWTSSFVLVAGGYSCLLLAAFHQIIEIWNYRKWAIPFVWIGTNALTIYLVVHFVSFPGLANRVVGGPVKAALGNAGELLVAAVVLLMVFALVRFLYNRKIFLRL